MSQVIGPCYIQQRLLICPCYVVSVPERTTLARFLTSCVLSFRMVFYTLYHAGRPGSSEVPRNPLTCWDVSSIPANRIVVYLTLLTGPLRIQLWSQDRGSYTNVLTIFPPLPSIFCTIAVFLRRACFPSGWCFKPCTMPVAPVAQRYLVTL